MKLLAFEFFTEGFDLGHIAGGSSLLDNFLDVIRFGVLFACEHEQGVCGDVPHLFCLIINQISPRV